MAAIEANILLPTCPRRILARKNEIMSTAEENLAVASATLKRLGKTTNEAEKLRLWRALKLSTLDAETAERTAMKPLLNIKLEQRTEPTTRTQSLFA